MVMVPEKVLQRRLKFEDYLSLPDDQDYEIIEGVLYVSPRPRPLHQVVAYRLLMLIGTHVEALSIGMLVPDADLIISERDTYVSPDIMFFAGDRFAGVNRDDFIRLVPDLIVEVLSPTTEDYDRRTKRRTYAELGVPHYWIVDPRSKTLIECTQPAAGKYEEHAVTPDQFFRPALFPDLAIDLNRLFL